jgi:hypothetical protein
VHGRVGGNAVTSSAEWRSHSGTMKRCVWS